MCYFQRINWLKTILQFLCCRTLRIKGYKRYYQFYATFEGVSLLQKMLQAAVSQILFQTKLHILVVEIMRFQPQKSMSADLLIVVGDLPISSVATLYWSLGTIDFRYITNTNN